MNYRSCAAIVDGGGQVFAKQPRRHQVQQLVFAVVLSTGFGAALPRSTFAQQDCLNWQLVQLPYPTGALSATVAAYDSYRGFLVAVDQNAHAFEWNGATWNRVADALPHLECLGQPCTVEFDPCTIGMDSSTCVPNPALWTPSPTFRGAIAFDKRRRVTVIYDINDEIREWDGQSWTLKEPSPSPGIISRPQMTYDPIREVIVMFGGWRPGSPSVTTNELWEWDGMLWTLRTSAQAPPPRFAHGQAFDESRGVFVVFGGRTDLLNPSYLDDLWDWDGNDWVQRFAPAGEPSPGIRFDHGMSFDALRKVIVVVGGRDNSAGFPDHNDVWDWNGASWRQRWPQPPPPPFTEPNGADLRARWTVYDDSRQMMHLVTGGIFHWALVHSLAPEVAAGPASQQVMEGTPVAFSVTTEPPTTVEFQWRKNGTPIPGANTAGHAIQSVTLADQGIYDVEVTRSGHDPYPPCGVVLSPPAALTVIPATPADLNADGAVDLVDFADFATMFGAPEP